MTPGWQSDRDAARYWSPTDILRLLQREHPTLSAADLSERAERVSVYQAWSIHHQRYDNRKFHRKNILVGGELFTDTDDRWWRP